MYPRSKPTATIISGISVLLLGILLRFFAYELCWPKEYSFSGPRKATTWGLQERALIDISWTLSTLGSFLILGGVLAPALRNRACPGS